MSRLWRAFWDWYERNYALNLSVAVGLFMLQLIHLYWLSAEVVLQRLTGLRAYNFGVHGRGPYEYLQILKTFALPAVLLLFSSLRGGSGERQGEAQSGPAGWFNRWTPGGADVDEGDGAGGGTPSMFAIAFRIFVTSAFVSHDGYLGGTMRSCLIEAFCAFAKSSTRFGSASRGRSVQAKPFAALNSAGALKIVSAPICSRIASRSVCWRCMRA